MAKTKGRCADFRDPTTRFLLMAEAHTVQFYKMVGMKVDLYSNKIVLGDRPQTIRQHFRIRNKSVFADVHFF
jgi:hypothetical protein